MPGIFPVELGLVLETLDLADSFDAAVAEPIVGWLVLPGDGDDHLLRGHAADDRVDGAEVDAVEASEVPREGDKEDVLLHQGEEFLAGVLGVDLLVEVSSELDLLLQVLDSLLLRFVHH